MRDVSSKRLSSPAIPIPADAIADLCRRHRVGRLSLFGSVLRTDFAAESDVDVLVEFEPEARVGFVEFVEMQDELSDVLGRKIDLFTPASLSRYIRDEVLAGARPVYAPAG